MTVFDYAPDIEPSELQILWELSFERSPRGIAIIEPGQRHVLAVNPSFARMHGGEVGDFTGKPIDDSLTPAGAARLPQLAAELDRLGFVSLESEHVRRDGSVFPVASEVMAAHDENGKLLYRICWFTDLTERRRLERERREAERQFENAFRNAAIGMAIAEVNGGGIRANAAFCQIAGYSEEELRRLDFAGITHPDDIEATFEGDERLLRGEAADYQLEKRYVRKDGEPVWVLISVSLDRDEDGEPSRYIVHVHDISVRKRMESDLSQSAAVAELSRDLICTVGPDDHLASLDGRWEEVLGWTDAELTSRPLSDFVHPDDREVTLGELARTRSSGRPGSFRSRWQTGGGTWSWLLWSVPGAGPDGQVFCAVREADERIEIEKAFELRGEVIANMAEGVSLVTTSDMRIVYANPAMERMYGFGLGEMRGQELVALMRPPNLSAEELAERTEVEQTLRARRTATYEARRRKRDDTEFWSRTTTTTFDHPHYGVVWITVQQDVTDERRARESAAELERAKSEFLGSISHELRTPLTSILGYAALLRADAGGPAEPLRQHIEVIERNAARQLRLVEDLLNIAQIEAGEFEFRQQPIDLCELVDEAAENVRPDAEAEELSLIVATSGPLAVMGDADRLAQVFSNLLTNAIKFTPPGGVIEVELLATEGEARLTVDDSGRGVEASELPYLFDRLYRGEDVKERQVAGAGLGLAISRAIVEAHQGRIEGRASRLGGACFEVALPALSRLPRDASG
ncbi:MAG TPA: PAS domain S-box protein [Solirubrobacterales bacterium]|nr:PAS domain S-box protein [Solirubrobacterales bacterium]